ncbi:MAG: hypothetical protein HZA50_00465 [Planctomycetes bacterium]|nr:hypothetical protein [Planctomycetota bacterium]
MNQGTFEILAIPPQEVPNSATTNNAEVFVVAHPSDATTIDQMNIVEISGELEFWNDPAENGYGPNDGKPV